MALRQSCKTEGQSYQSVLSGLNEEYGWMSSTQQWQDMPVNLLKRVPRRSIYKVNKIGPKTEPWGTPQDRTADLDRQGPSNRKTLLCKVWREPVQSAANDTHPLFELKNHYAVTLSIKGCTKVQKHQEEHSSAPENIIKDVVAIQNIVKLFSSEFF